MLFGEVLCRIPEYGHGGCGVFITGRLPLQHKGNGETTRSKVYQGQNRALHQLDPLLTKLISYNRRHLDTDYMP